MSQVFSAVTCAKLWVEILESLLKGRTNPIRKDARCLRAAKPRTNERVQCLQEMEDALSSMLKLW